MNNDLNFLLASMPQAPDWKVLWRELDERFWWIRQLRGCVQDPVWHAEGDVWVHTEMVLSALSEDLLWRQLNIKDRQAVYLAAIMHDVAKPQCTRERDNRIVSPGHSRIGATMARNILWQLGLEFSQREQICGLIQYHQTPFFLIDRSDRERLALTISVRTRHDLLAILARADIRGRDCRDQSATLDNIDLASEYVKEELDCWRKPWSFTTDHSRCLYFRDEHRTRFSTAYDDTEFTVTVLSGLPGSGKDRWIENHSQGFPVISLDRIRKSLGVKPTKSQAKVVATAQEKARECLRSRQPYVWNATNISVDLRSLVLTLAAGYGARLRIVYVETDFVNQKKQNKNRKNAVPDRVIERLKTRWTVPDLTEAHQIDYVVNQ